MPQLAQHLKWTYEDFLLFPDDGKRHELIDGEHIMSPSPITKHQRILLNIARIISNFLKSHRIGEVFIAPMDVVLSDFDVVEPDLLFIASPHASIITKKHIMGVPDLVVEILSVSSRKTDEIIKRRLYEQYGVQEYWIVDPELDSVKMYRIEGGGYVKVAELSVEAGDSLTTPCLPTLTIALSEIFE
ncbi:MAG: Uma2 family endonuclease [Nitrospirae bacterium]|nr:Uma2 family endonuclease [Nitrospirota bacterium]